MPRRGPPVAALKVPRRYRRDEWRKRQPRGSDPRGPQRGGPERTANDPRRNPRGSLCGGPERSAKEPQTPPKASHGKANGGNAGKPKPSERKRPAIITIDGSGHERRWGPLTRTNAWRVGRFWDDMKGKVDVFLEKPQERKQVKVELRVQGGRQKFWFVEKTPETPQSRPEERDDDSITEEVDEESVAVGDSVTEKPTTGMSEDDPKEREIGQKMWLAETVTSLEKENGDLKMALQEMETRLATQENMARLADERCARLEAAITKIADFVQQQNSALESSRALMNRLVEEVSAHRDNFQKVGLVMNIHEQHMVQSGAITQEMAQYINALIQENQQKSLYIGSLVKEYQAQAEVIRQHQMGQQVIAEVIKRIVAGQGPQQTPQPQGTAGRGLTVSEIDDHDPDRLDFLGAQNPNSGPPTTGPFGTANQIIQVPASLAIVQRL